MAWKKRIRLRGSIGESFNGRKSDSESLNISSNLISPTMVNIAQLVRVPDCDSGSREFKSRYSPQMINILSRYYEEYTGTIISNRKDWISVDLHFENGQVKFCVYNLKNGKVESVPVREIDF